MTIQNEIVTFVIAAAGAASLIVSKAFAAVSVSEQPHSWVGYLLGPLGAVFVMGVAVLWLSRKLDRKEKEEKETREHREEEEKEARKSREEILVKLVEATTVSARALDRNSKVLDRIEEKLNQK